MALRRDPLPRVVRRTLTAREKIIVSVHRHWAWLVAPVAMLLIATLAALWFSMTFPTAAPTLIWFAWLVIVFRTGWHWFNWWRQSFIITTERIILVRGGFTVTQTQIPLELGKDITLRQSMVGQWFGFGDFILEATPQDHSMHEVTYLPDCERLHRRITRLLQGDPVELVKHPTPEKKAVEDVVADDIVTVDETSRSEPQRL